MSKYNGTSNDHLLLLLVLPYRAVFAKFKEIFVCGASSSSGEMFTNISVFPSFARYLCSRWVNFEFRYGTCYVWYIRPWITFPKQLKDLFMNCVYLRANPSTLLCFNLSLPAKSTSTREPSLLYYEPILFPSMRMVTIKCERLDR